MASPPNWDSAVMDVDALLRTGIAEAHMATVARLKRDRVQHLHTARELLTAALRRCGATDLELRAHLLAVLLKLGEDARALQGIELARPSSRALHAAEHSSWQVPLVAATAATSMAVDEDQCSIVAPSEWPSDWPSETTSVTPSVRFFDYAEIPEDSAVGVPDPSSANTPSPKPSPKSLESPCRKSVSPCRSPSPRRRSVSPRKSGVLARPLDCEFDTACGFQEGGADGSGIVETAMGTFPEWPPLSSRIPAKIVGRPSYERCDSLPSDLRVLVQNEERARSASPMRSERIRPRHRSATERSSVADSPDSPQAGLKEKETKEALARIRAELLSSISPSPSRASQPQQSTGSRFVKRRRNASAPEVLWQDDSSSLSATSSAVASAEALLSSRQSAGPRQGCQPSQQNGQSASSSSGAGSGASSGQGGGGFSDSDTSSAKRGVGSIFQLSPVREAQESTEDRERKALVERYAPALAERSCSSGSRTPPGAGGIVSSPTPHRGVLVNEEFDKAAGLEQAVPGVFGARSIQNPLSQPELFPEASSALPRTESCNSLAAVSSPASSHCRGSPSGSSRFEADAFAGDIFGTDAFAADAFAADAFAVDNVWSNESSPSRLSSADDRLSVRILNGVSGEEEVRFCMSMQDVVDEDVFWTNLDKRCQQEGGQALAALSWLSQAQPGGCYERRTCDRCMHEALFADGLSSRAILMLCTVPVRPPSELLASKVRLRDVVPSRVACSPPGPGAPPVRLRLSTSALEDGHSYSVAFTHQWSNVTYTEEASVTVLPGLRGVELCVPKQMLLPATNGSSSTEGLYDVHLVIDRSSRSENRKTLSVGSGDSDLSSSMTDRSAAFVPIARGGPKLF